MDNQFKADVEGLRPHCGLAVTGPGSAVCRDPKCLTRTETPIAGYCLPCAVRRGLQPVIINPVEACAGQESA